MVKSVDAFSDAARQDDKSRNIQVGYYQLKKQMKASDALAVLVDPDNLIQSLVVVPEGARVRQIVETIVDKTDITQAGRHRGAREPEGDRAAGARRRATPRATCSRRPTRCRPSRPPSA